MADELLLDVSDLEPPEPLELTLNAAEQLKPGQYIRMLHRREPCLLYSNLEASHFKYLQRKGKTVAIEVFIWCKDDIDAEKAIQKIIQTS